MTIKLAEPGSTEAKEQGCTCSPLDQAAVIDAAVADALGPKYPSHEATGQPSWGSRGCPYCDQGRR